MFYQCFAEDDNLPGPNHKKQARDVTSRFGISISIPSSGKPPHPQVNRYFPSM